MIVLITTDGKVKVVAHDSDLPVLAQAVGPVATQRRGGHVVPAAPLRRWAFKLLRRLASRAAAAWTRTWRGQWLADLTVSGGPVLGPFATRLEAIAAEEDWLASRLAA
jgi:hypothetical protein